MKEYWEVMVDEHYNKIYKEEEEVEDYEIIIDETNQDEETLEKVYKEVLNMKFPCDDPSWIREDDYISPNHYKLYGRLTLGGLDEIEDIFYKYKIEYIIN